MVEPEQPDAVARFGDLAVQFSDAQHELAPFADHLGFAQVEFDGGALNHAGVLARRGGLEFFGGVQAASLKSAR